MPWDKTQLWVSDIKDDGSLSSAYLVAGKTNESISQPRWSANGELYFISDRDNWWNLYRTKPISSGKPIQVDQITKVEGEFATPQWSLGDSTYAFLSSNTLLATYLKDGVWHLVKIDISTQQPKLVHLDCRSTLIEYIDADQDRGVFVGSSFYESESIYTYSTLSDSCKKLVPKPKLLREEEISFPQHIKVPTTNNQVTYGLYYPPHNSAYISANELPPVIVLCHGGPTGAASASLDLRIQFWTNRGFAVVDVDYRGSSGYGRDYRQSLYGNWGIYDVNDACAVVDYLAINNQIDKARTIIKGGSAGGFTALSALVHCDYFSAGVILYGVSNLLDLASETHRFEKYYLDRLLGDSTENREVYVRRSPSTSTNDISVSVLFFQGMRDKVVPPNQSEQMFRNIIHNNPDSDYITFDDEGHGFRSGKTIIEVVTREAGFYSTVFKLPVHCE